MTPTLIYREPLDHFAWVIAQHPDADKLELMKLAFNHGLSRASSARIPIGTFTQRTAMLMLPLDLAKLNPPLTPEQWRRGP